MRKVAQANNNNNIINNNNNSNNNNNNRAPAVKRKKPSDIEKIIGNTVSHHSCVSVSPNGEEIAYCAGCTVVVYSPKKNTQLKFLQNPSENKPFTSVCFSSDGKRIAAGESGYQPSVLIWDTVTGRLICDLKEDRHKFGVRFVVFSPDSKYLVSVGNEHDGTIKIWANKAKTFDLVCSKTNPRKTNAVSFAADGSYFITAGAKHVIYWTFRSTTFGSKVEVMATKANLNAFGESTFVSVACAKQTKDGVYCLTTEGILCLIDSKKAVDKWVELKMGTGYSISVSENIVCCGGGTGFVRLFETKTLKYKGTLPKPPPTGTHVTSSNWIANKIVGQQLPVPGAISVDLKGSYVTAFYEDRTMIVWDISNLQHFTKYRSMISHSDSIMDVDYLPESNTVLPQGTFVTCSTDNTIRFWNIDGEDKQSDVANNSNNNNNNVRGSIAQQNIFFRDLLHIINIPYARNSESETGIKCVRFSPDGNVISSGDFQGNIRVHDVCTFKTLSDTPAHDTVVTSLDFAQADGKVFFATGSRDRHVHLFRLDNAKTCQCVATMNEHSGAVTCVKFAVNDGVRLLSCGTDKSIKFRFIASGDDLSNVELYDNKAVPYGTIFDMDVDTTQKYAVTTGQDKRLNIWDLKKKSSVRSYKTEVDSDVIKVKIDPSGIFTAGSFTDKTIRLYDFFNGSFVKKFKGHSEVVTGLAFSHDGRRLITVSGDGCIFVWRLPIAIVVTIQDRLAELKLQGASPPSPSKIEEAAPTVTCTDSVSPRMTRPSIPNDQLESLRSMATRNSQEHEPNKTLDKPIEISLAPSLPAWAKVVRDDVDDQDLVIKRKNAWAERQVSQLQLPQHDVTMIADQTMNSPQVIDDTISDLKQPQSTPVQKFPDFNAQYEDEDDVVYTSDSELEDNVAEVEADRNVLVYDANANDEGDFFIKSQDKLSSNEKDGDEEKTTDDEADVSVEMTEELEEPESKQSEFVSKHFENLDKPVAMSDVRRSVTYQFLQKNRSNGSQPTTVNTKPSSSDHDDLKDVINALPASRFSDLTQNNNNNNNGPSPPPEPNNRSSIFDNLNLIRQQAIKKKVNTNFKKEVVDQYLNFHKEALTKYDGEKKEKSEQESEVATGEQTQVVVTDVSTQGASNGESVKCPEATTNNENAAPAQGLMINPCKETGDNNQMECASPPNNKLNNGNIMVLDQSSPRSGGASEHDRSPPTTTAADTVPSSPSIGVQESINITLTAPDNSESVVISQPIQVSKSISICKHKIETLSRVFSETMQSIDEMAKSITETPMTEEDDVEQVSELINNVESMLDTMKQKLSNQIQSTNISTVLSGRLTTPRILSNDRSQTQTQTQTNTELLNVSQASTVDSSVNLAASLSTPEITNVLERYSSMMVDMFMKKLADKTRE